MPNLLELRKAYLDRLSSREEQAVSRIQTIYIQVYQNLVKRLEDLIVQIEDLQASGKKITKAYIYESTRLTETMTQLVVEMREFTDQVSTEIASASKDAATLALESSKELIKAAVGVIPNNIDFDASFLRFDQKAAEQMVARFSDASPIRQDLEKYVGNLIGQVETLFVQSIVQGLPPRVVAQELYKKFGLSYVNAQTSAYTNIISAYRDGNLERYKESKVVSGWMWSATLDDRTCPVCVFMDGQTFSLDVPFATHPVCRCSPIPVTFTWKELGIDAFDYKPDLGLRGEEWFKAQPDETKFKILKKRKFALYQQGKIKLGDLTHYFVHPRYGPEREEYSILDLKRLKIIK